MVELVGLPAVTRDERVPGREIEPEEAEDAAGDTVVVVFFDRAALIALALA